MPLDKFLEKVWDENAHRVEGMAIYMSGHSKFAPPTIIQSYRHFKCLHEYVVFLTVETMDIPHVPPSNRVSFQTIGPQIYRLIVHYGFMDFPNVCDDINGIVLDKWATLNTDNVTFFLGRENLMASHKRGMSIWREKLFAVMSRNSQPATNFFNLPKERVVEIGSTVEL